MILVFRYIFSHLCISLDILHLVIVHNTEISIAKCLRHSKRNLRLSLYHLGAGLLCFRFHLLLKCHSHSPSLLRTCLGDILVRLGLVYLKERTDILSYINVGYIN